MYRKYRSMAALAVLLVAAMLVSGCLGIFSKSYKLTVNVKPEGAAEVKGVDKKYSEGATATFTLEFDAEAYEYVGVDVEGVLVEEEEGVLNVEVADIKENITITFEFEEIEEEPVDPEEAKAAAKEAAEEAIADLPSVVTLAEEEEIAEAIADARGLVDYAVELGVEEDDIEGIEVLEELEERFEAILAQLKGHVIKLEKVIDVLNKDQDDVAGEDVVFAGENFVLPGEIDIEGVKYVLLWGFDSPYLEYDEKNPSQVNVAVRPDEDTIVVLTATLGIKTGPVVQAIPQEFEVSVVLEGWVSKAVAAAKDAESDDFKTALEGLKIEYDQSKVNAYIAAVAGLVKVTKDDIVSIVAEEFAAEIKVFNKSVKDYFTSNVVEEKDTAYGYISDNGISLDFWQSGLVDEVYLPALENKVFASKPELQRFVDGLNLAHLAELVVAAEANVGEYAEANNFFTVIESSLEKDVKEGFQETLDEVKKYYDVVAAIDWTEFKNALDELKVKGAVESLLGDYLGAFDDEVPVGFDIQQVIDDVNEEKVSDAVDAVLEAVEEEGGDVTEALGKLKGVTPALDWPDTFSNAEDYAELIAAEEPTTAEEIVAIIVEVDLVAAINADDADLGALIIDMDIEEFINLKSNQRVEVAGLLEEAEYKSSFEFSVAVKDKVAAYLKLLADLNAAENTTEVRQALAAFSSEFAELSSEEQVNIATYVFENRPVDGYEGLPEIDEEP